MILDLSKGGAVVGASSDVICANAWGLLTRDPTLDKLVRKLVRLELGYTVKDA